MDSARKALIVLLLSALGVVSCATWIERRGEAQVAAAALAAPAPVANPVDEGPRLLIPVKGVTRAQLRDNFAERRGVRLHKALDIMAKRGTPVVAADDGTVAKVYRHPLGGLSVYQYDAERRYVYYYAHLDSYARGVKEGAYLRRGDPVGYVGTTGNASPNSPHLHFAMHRLGRDGRWYRGTPVNPYPYLRE